jgi:hypothetical protein
LSRINVIGLLLPDRTTFGWPNIGNVSGYGSSPLRNAAKDYDGKQERKTKLASSHSNDRLFADA